MAFAARMPRRNKTLALFTVASLHGIVLYGLVTGLGATYVEQVIPVLTGRNIPLEPPPPPKVEPAQHEASNKTDNARPTSLKPISGLPTRNTEIAQEFPQLPLLPLTPLEKPAIDPITPPSAVPLGKAAAPLGSPANWVSTDDYPIAALRRGDQGAVRFDLAIGPDGRVTGCRIVASSGSAELDAATCRLVSRRARFRAANDDTGSRVAGSYTGTIRWIIPAD